jgi:hypothetical protein
MAEVIRSEQSHSRITTVCAVICTIVAVIALPATLYCGWAEYQIRNPHVSTPDSGGAGMVNDRIFDYAFAAVLICCAIFCVVAIIFVVWLILRRTAKQPVQLAPTSEEAWKISSGQVPNYLLDSLQVEVLEVSRALRSFLLEIGPRPQVGMGDFRDSEGYLKAHSESVSPWYDKLWYGYERRLKRCTTDTFLKLAELGYMDDARKYADNVKQSEDIEKMSKALAGMVGRIDIERRG